MIATGFFVNNFSGSSFFKALGSGAIGFYFRHEFFSFYIKNRWRGLSRTGPRHS
jgi:hypothetical protein